MNGRRWLQSLRLRFFAAILLVLIVLFGGAIFNTNRLLSAFSIENTQAIIAQTSEILNLAISPHTSAKDLDELESYLNELIRNDGQAITYLALVDHDGHLLIKTPDTPNPLPQADAGLEQQIVNGLIHVKQPMLLGDNHVGQLRFGFSTKQIEQARQSIVLNNVLLLMGGLLFSSVLMILMGSRIGRQFADLIKASQALAAGELTSRAFVSGNNELSALAHNFNFMADALALRTEALQESESKLRALFDGAQDGILVMNIETRRFINANPSMCALAGYTREELLTLSERDLCPDTGQSFSLTQFKNQSHDEPSISTETPILRQGGSILLTDIRTSYLSINGLPHLAIFFRDDTERLRAVQAVKRESAKNIALLRNASDGIHILDGEGNIVEVSDSFCIMLGYTRDELIGMNVSAWDAGLNPAELSAILKTQFDSKVRVQFESKHRRKDGSIFDVEVSGYPLKLDGKPMLFNSSRDISERKRIQSELQQSNQRFRSLFESSPDPVWIIDGHRFVECNQAAVEMLGYPNKHALLNTHPSELSPEYQPDGEESFGKAERMMVLAQQQGMHRFEWLHTRADQSTFFAEVTLSMINLDGHQVIYCVWRDISLRKQAEAALQKSQRHLTMAIESSKMVVWECDMVSNQLSFDDVALSLLDILPDDSLRTLQGWMAIVHPEDLPVFIEHYQALMQATASIFDLEYRHIQQSGQSIWLHTRGQVIQRDADGHPLMAVGSTMNVNDRKNVEIKSQENETLLRVMLESTDEGILMIGQCGQVLSANKRFLELWRMPESLLTTGKDELMIEHVLEQLVDPDAFVGQVQRLYSSDDEAHDTLYFKDGRVFARYTRALVVNSERGRIWCFKDISEQARARDKLLRSEANLNRAQAIGQIGSWHFDLLTGRQEWSAETYRMFGIQDQAVIDLDVFVSKIHPDDRNYVLQGWQAAIIGAEYDLEHRIVVNDQIRWIRERAEFEWNACGQAISAIGTAQDITSRKMAAEKLRTNEEKYRGIFDNSIAVVYVFDNDKKFTDSNQAGLDLLGYSREELLQLSIPDVDADPVAVLPAHNHLFEGGRLINFEHSLRRKDGSVVTVLNNSSPLKDAQGNVIGMMSTLLDITQRKQTEEQLRKLAQAVEQSLESVLITDLNGRIEYVNEAFVRNTGYEREEVIGRTPSILHSGLTPVESFQSFWQAMNQGQSWKGEFYNQRKDGSVFIDSVIVTPIRQPDGRITHYVAVQEDITDKKRLSEELEQYRHHLERLVDERTNELMMAKASAEAANVAKSAFLANMSHEIRTPLNAVLGVAKIGFRDSQQEMERNHFRQILNSGHHLLGVINDILDFSKIEANKMMFDAHNFSLISVVEDAMNHLLDQAKAKGLSLSTTLSPELSEWVDGDSLRLRQILLNLLSNAVKFTQHGTVSIRVSGAVGNMVTFQVTDTGIGMTEEQISQLFQPFHQADNSTTRRFGGTGLGLVISRRLAEMMGGKLAVISTQNVGSTFTLTLPLPAVDPSSHKQHTEDLTPQARQRLLGYRVLAVEDVEINRFILEDLLADEGAHIVFAEHGLQAIERLEEIGIDAFDVVLMDIQMPIMDGYEAARRIAAMAPKLPIIGLTAHALEEEREKCLASGMVDHVTKPIDVDALIAAILRSARTSEILSGHSREQG